MKLDNEQNLSVITAHTFVSLSIENLNAVEPQKPVCS